MEEERPKDSAAHHHQSASEIEKGTERDPYPIKTLNAPNGVTRIAGAKAYAAKLATSPIPTAKKTLSPLSLPVNGTVDCTCKDTTPPNRTLEVREAFSFETVSLRRLHQPLTAKSASRILST